MPIPRILTLHCVLVHVQSVFNLHDTPLPSSLRLLVCYDIVATFPHRGDATFKPGIDNMLLLKARIDQYHNRVKPVSIIQSSRYVANIGSNEI